MPPPVLCTNPYSSASYRFNPWIYYRKWNDSYTRIPKLRTCKPWNYYVRMQGIVSYILRNKRQQVLLYVNSPTYQINNTKASNPNKNPSGTHPPEALNLTQSKYNYLIIQPMKTQTYKGIEIEWYMSLWEWKYFWYCFQINNETFVFKSIKECKKEIDKLQNPTI